MRVVTVVASSLGLVIAIACLVNYRGDDAVLSIRHHEVVQEQSAEGGSIMKQTVNNNLMAYYQQQGTKVYRTKKKPVADTAAAAFMVSQRRYEQIAPETQFTQDLDMDLEATYPVISASVAAQAAAAMDSMGASAAVQDEQDDHLMTGAHKAATSGLSKSVDKRKATKAQMSDEEKEATAAKAKAELKVQKQEDAAAAKATAKLDKRAQAMQGTVQSAEKAALGYITSLHETNTGNIKKTNAKIAAENEIQQTLTSTLTKELHRDLVTEQGEVAKAKDAIADAKKSGTQTEKSAEKKAAAILAAAKMKSKAKIKVKKGATSNMLESELGATESAATAQLENAKAASLKDEAAIQDQLEAVNEKAKKTQDNAAVHALQVEDDNQAKILQAREAWQAVKMKVAVAKRKARQQAKKDLVVQQDTQQRKLNVVKAAAQKAVANAANAKADSKS